MGELPEDFPLPPDYNIAPRRVGGNAWRSGYAPEEGGLTLGGTEVLLHPRRECEFPAL